MEFPTFQPFHEEALLAFQWVRHCLRFRVPLGHPLGRTLHLHSLFVWCFFLLGGALLKIKWGRWGTVVLRKGSDTPPGRGSSPTPSLTEGGVRDPRNQTKKDLQELCWDRGSFWCIPLFQKGRSFGLFKAQRSFPALNAGVFFCTRGCKGVWEGQILSANAKNTERKLLWGVSD